MHYSKIGLLAFLICISGAARAQDQRLKLEGVWDGESFYVDRIKERDPYKDVRRIRVAGAVSRISPEFRELEVGPVRLYWPASLDAELSGMQRGDVVELDAMQTGPDYFTVLRIGPTRVDSDASIELIGALTGFSTHRDWTDLYVAGIPARIPRNLFANGRTRLHRLGDRRPDNQFTTSIGNVRTTIGGEFGLRARALADRDLDAQRDDKRLDAEAQVQLEAFFEISDTVSTYAEIKAQQSGRFNSSSQSSNRQFEVRRGELWLYVAQPFGLPGGIQIGRLNFAEHREWWWDQNLDAIRVFAGNRGFQFEAALAEELGPRTISGEHSFAADRDVRRLFLTARMRLSSAVSIETRLLRQQDNSSSFNVADVIALEQEDEEDADLTWAGVRLMGGFNVLGRSEVRYWADYARVSGSESVYDFDDVGATGLVVESVVEQSRSGTGFDLGTTVILPDFRFLGLSEPALTIGYAGGSGNGRSDGTFRQTGLQDNNSKFGGVDRFRYYGELSRPNLENIRISTLALGFRFGLDSSVELLHHRYWQDHETAEHSLRLSPDANGRSGNLGNELDLVIGIEKWRHFEFEAVAGYFSPGTAFDTADPSWLISLKLDYNF